MSEIMMTILQAIEGMTEKELEYISVWIEYNQQKKEALSAHPHSE
jgi:hypothetical protein